MKNWHRSLGAVVVILAVILVSAWVLKLRNIQRLKTEIEQWETRLSKGQALWQENSPLTPEQKRELVETQQRLIAMLPKDKDVPPVLQEISRVARQYRLEDVTFKTGDRVSSGETSQAAPPPANVSQVVVSQPEAQAGSKDAENSGPIDSFAVSVAFLGEYRATAYFLEAVQRIPRVLRIQSVKLQRQFPIVSAEVVLNAYYQKGVLN